MKCFATKQISWWFSCGFCDSFPPRLQKSWFAKKLMHLGGARGLKVLGEGITKIIDTPASNAHWIQCDPSLQITPDFYGILDGCAVDGCHSVSKPKETNGNQQSSPGNAVTINIMDGVYCVVVLSMGAMATHQIINQQPRVLSILTFNGYCTINSLLSNNWLYTKCCLSAIMATIHPLLSFPNSSPVDSSSMRRLEQW